MADTAQDMVLGTLFTADTTQLMQAVRQIESVLGRINRAMGDMANKASSVTGTISSIGSTSANAAPGLERSAKAMREYDKALEGVSRRGRAFSGAFEQVAAGINKNSAAHHDIADTVVETEKNLARTRAQFGHYLENIKGISKGTKEWNSEMARLRETAFTTGQKGSLLSNAAMARYIGVIGESRGALTKWIGSQEGATKAFKEFDRLIAKSEGNVRGMSGFIGDMGFKLKNLGEYAIAATAIYGVFDVLRAGTKEIVGFNQALKNIEAISQSATYQVSAMAGVIKDIARETKFSTVELGNGMVTLQQAGFTTAETLDSIRAVANLATGTLTNMDTATDLLTTSLRAFGEESSESSRISDIWANSINKSKLTIDKIRIALNYVGVAASQSNVKIEEAAAAMMTLANSGLRASTIGTGLRNVFAKMLNPSQKLAEALQAQNMSVTDINPKLVGFQTSMRNLTSVLWDAENQTVKMGLAYKSFGLRGQAAAAALVKSFATGSEFDDALGKVYEVGTAAEMSATQQEGLAVKFKNVADRAKLVAVELGEAGLNGVLSGMIELMKLITSGLEAIAKSDIAKTILQISTLAGGAVLLNKALTSFSTAGIVANYIAGLKGMGVAMATTKVKTDLLTASTKALKWALAAIDANPFVAAVAGGIAMVAVLKRVVEWNRKAAEAAAKQGIEQKRAFDVIASYIEKLKGAEKNSDEYRAAVERLKKEHRGYANEIASVAGVIDLASASHKDLEAAMETVARNKMEESVRKKGEALQLLSRDMSQASSRMGYWDTQLKYGEISYEKYLNATKGMRETIKTYDSMTRDLVLSLRDQVAAQEMTREEAEKMIDTYARSEAAAKQMKDQLGTAMDELVTQHIAELNRSYTELFDLVEEKVKGLKTSYEELQSKISEVNSQMASEEERYQKAIRDIKRKTMTDEEKWMADRKEANRLLNEGIKAQDEDMLKKAQDMFKGLARTVKNENGDVVREVEETARLAEKGVSDAHTAVMSVLKNKKKAFEEDAKTIQEKIDAANGKLNEFKDKIDEISKQSMTLNTEDAERKIEKLRKEAERLNKEISGKSSGSSSSSSTSSSTPAFATGGRVFGAGHPPGIDTIPARLTADEFVAPVASTRKYDFPIFEGLRRLRYPVENIRAVMAAGTQKFSDLFRKSPKFFDGGRVTFNPPPTPVFNNHVSTSIERLLAKGYQSGGRAQKIDLSGLERYGQFDLAVPGGGSFKAIAQQDPLKLLQKQLERERMRGRN